MYSTTVFGLGAKTHIVRWQSPPLPLSLTSYSTHTSIVFAKMTAKDDLIPYGGRIKPFSGRGKSLRGMVTTPTPSVDEG